MNPEAFNDLVYARRISRLMLTSVPTNPKARTQNTATVLIGCRLRGALQGSSAPCGLRSFLLNLQHRRIFVVRERKR